MSDMNLVFDQAYKMFEDKKFDSALEMIEKAETEMTANNIDEVLPEEQRNELLASINNFKGYNYLGMGDVEKAKEAFEKALETNPNSSQACAGLGEVLFLCGMDQEAKILYEWSLDLNPTNKVAEAGLMKVNKSLGLPDYHYTLNIDMTINKKAKFYSKVADAYNLFNVGKYNDALDTLRTLDDTYNPQYASSDAIIKGATLQNFKGFNYLALNKYDEAKACFEKALTLNPDSSQACAGLGELFYLNNKDKEAKAMFEWAVKNNPNNNFAVAGLAKVNEALGFAKKHSFLELNEEK